MHDMKLHSLFITGKYDPEKNLIHGTACLADPSGSTVGHVTCSQAGHMDGASWSQDAGDHAAGLAAFELGCVMAAMNGVTKVLLHAPDQVDHDVMFRAREDKSVKTDAEGGMDYFGSGVFVYRPGDGAVLPAWKEKLIKDIAAMDGISTDKRR